MRQAAATLTSASISFRTNDENKDWDSHVTITVKDGSKIIAARTDSDFGVFNANTNYGPYGLDIFSPSAKSSVQAGTITIRIDPVGHDTWRFNFVLTLLFSDGTRLLAAVDGNELTQNHKEQTWRIIS